MASAILNTMQKKRQNDFCKIFSRQWLIWSGITVLRFLLAYTHLLGLFSVTGFQLSNGFVIDFTNFFV